LGDLPESEIGKIELFDALPEKLTYPEIQPYLYNMVVRHNQINNKSICQPIFHHPASAKYHNRPAMMALCLLA